MNIDNGNIRPWDSLTMEERSSGRWIKLSDDEFAMAERIPEEERPDKLAEIFRQYEDRRHPGDFKGRQ